MLHTRAVGTPAVLVRVCGSGYVDVQTLGQQSVKDTPTLTSLQIYHLHSRGKV